MKKTNNFFWISLSDLMISMFFIMLVVVSVEIIINDKLSTEISDLKKKLENCTNCEKEIADLTNKTDSLTQTVTVLKKEKKIIENVQKNIEQLKEKKDLFKYDDKFKRYVLKFNVEFKNDRSDISDGGLVNPRFTKNKLIETGNELKKVIDNLAVLKASNPAYKDVSYFIVVSGSASRLGDVDHNYSLSYMRAYNLYKFWKQQGIDFDSEVYHNLVDFQIAGNGFGGVGREKPEIGYSYTYKNQRFIINIIPKIGSFNEER